MKSALAVCVGVAFLTATASTADAWRAATGPRGGAAVAGPRGAAVRGPGGNVAVAGRGGYAGAYHGGAYYGGRPYYGAGAVAAWRCSRRRRWCGDDVLRYNPVLFSLLPVLGMTTLMGPRLSARRAALDGSLGAKPEAADLQRGLRLSADSGPSAGAEADRRVRPSAAIRLPLLDDHVGANEDRW
jgi:hypothetical protein